MMPKGISSKIASVTEVASCLVPLAVSTSNHASANNIVPAAVTVMASHGDRSHNKMPEIKKTTAITRS
jgi:hypothetical protein